MMFNLAIVFAVFLTLPFLLGYLHASMQRETAAYVIYYRYFILFNMVFSGVIVAIRLFFDGPAAAAASGWSYSPVFHLYAIAVLSMALPGLLVLVKRGVKVYGPAITWAIFLLLTTLIYVYQILNYQIKDYSIIYLHMIYNVIVAVVLIYFVLSLITRCSAKTLAPSNTQGAESL